MAYVTMEKTVELVEQQTGFFHKKCKHKRS